MNGRQLVVVIGWSIDDFLYELPRSTPDELQRALTILLEEDPPSTPDWIISRSKAGVKLIREELSRRAL
jgi:hypothetical protein